MKHENFNMKEHGFVGHLAEPDNGSDRAVIVIMGGEQSLLPGIVFAERLADFGFTGLAVSLFGAEGRPASPDRVPVDMFIPAAEYLRNTKGVKHLSVYGQSMGSIFASLTAQYIGGFENLIIVSPTHVPFEGTLPDRKTMSCHSVAVWQGRELPFVRPDFSEEKPIKYKKLPGMQYKVTGMWAAFRKAYDDKQAEESAMLHPEKSDARILMIAGAEDEDWDSAYSVRKIEEQLKKVGYGHDVKLIIFPHGSHLCGLLPNTEREKRLYRMMPFIGIMYKTFGKYRKENLEYFARAEKEIIEWVKQ